MEISSLFGRAFEMQRSQITAQRVGVGVCFARDGVSAILDHLEQRRRTSRSSLHLFHEGAEDSSGFDHVALIVEFSAPHSSAYMLLLSAAPFEEMHAETRT